jgi:hypothetical protein
MRIAVTSWLLTPVAMALAMGGAITLDRIAVIVGKRAIKTSDIDRDIRLTAFLNRERPDFSSQAKHQSAERLIDQEIIRQEIVTGSYRRPADSRAEELEVELVRDRFGGSKDQLRLALAQDGLTEDQLRAGLLWQITVLQFINERFRGAVFLSNDEVEQYERQHEAALQKQNPGADAATLESKAREILEGERVNQNFMAWLEAARKRTRIEYKPEAFA